MLATLLPALAEALAEGVDAACAAARALGDPLGPRLDEALRLSADALEADPDALPNQLLARLDGRSAPEQALLDHCRRDARGLVPRAPALLGPFPPLKRRWTAHERQVNALLVLPDGDTLVSASEDGQLLVWSLTDPAVQRKLEGHVGPVNRMDLSPDGAVFVTAGDDRTVWVWDTGTLACRHTLTGHRHHVRGVAVSNDRVMSVCEDKAVRTWDRDSGAVIEVAEGAHRHMPRAVALSKDGNRGVTSSVDNAVLVWDPGSGERDGEVYDADAQVSFIGTLYLALGSSSDVGHRDGPGVLVFTEDGALLSAEKELIRWDADMKAEAWVLPHAWTINALALVPGQPWAVTASYDLKLVDLDRGAVIHTLPGPKHGASAVAVTPDGRTVVAGGEKGHIEVWRLDPNDAQDQHISGVSDVAISPDGRRVATCDSDNVVRLWDPSTGRWVATLDIHPESGPRPLAWLPDGRLMTTRRDARKEGPNLFVWTADGERVADFRIERSEGWASSVSALKPLWSGLVLVSNLRGGVVRLDLFTGEITPFEDFTQQVSEIVVSADDRHAATLGYFSEDDAQAEKDSGLGDSRGQLQGWDMTTGRCLWREAAVIPEGEEWGSTFSMPLFAGDRLLHAVTVPDRVQARDPETGRVLETWDLPGWCAHLVWDGESLWAACHEAEDSPYPVGLFRLEESSRLVREATLPASLRAARIWPEAGLVGGALGDEVVLMDFSGEEVARMRCDAAPRKLALLSGEVLVAGCADGRVVVMELRA
ncbi:MAG: WD40 repeat domain-containing protein [Alphaproteobacteria bacterium]|nr:WD40 repeat domain-containing protein [Alphaproteobacteria bacterium]MCB9797737.1 WD40 repeat domain-containing protein [Alphaproteobacteria bacterium]